MKAYVEGHNPAVSEIKTALRRATLDNRLVPVLCGSALKNKGYSAITQCHSELSSLTIGCATVEGIDPKTGR